MKPFVFVAIVACLMCLNVSMVFAHVVAEDTNALAVLHIDPGDNPIIGQPARLHFSFSDDKNGLDLRTCNCDVSITSNNTTLFSKPTSDPVFILEDHTLEFDYVFEKKALYTITIRNNDQKLAFVLPFEIRVDRESDQQTPDNSGSHHGGLRHQLSYLATFGVALAVGGLLTIRKARRGEL